MKIKLRKIKRLVLQILRIIFRPKLLTLVTLALFLSDYILYRILGDNFEEKSTLLNTIFTVGQINITLGFTAILVSKLKNVKWYKSVSLLFGLSVITFFIYFRFTEPRRSGVSEAIRQLGTLYRVRESLLRQGFVE